MAGIYIHIPFCKQACYYCNFHFSTSLDLKDEMIAALIKEIKLSSLYLLNDKSETEIIETVYFGGGTPSLLNNDDIKNLLDAVRNNYTKSKDAEITIEANPDDINKEKLSTWKDAGINRLSIGIQSFKQQDLQWMNRAHNTTQAFESIVLAKDAGFNNFSVDLIYGTPGLTDEEWKMNVEQVINSGSPHIACYALTVEPKTALQKMIALKKKVDIDTDQQANQFLLLMKWLKEAGYEHYEISNFAKPGYRSRHNSSYWQGKKYIGIGPSAHSYDGKSRRWNIANNPSYIKSIKNNIIPFEEEKLTNVERLNEYIMTSLRTIEGLDLKTIEHNFSAEERKRIENAVIDYINKKMIIYKNECLILSNEGKLFADRIASQLFFTT
ncbi:radical SAM family heme chaperone HemW [Ginsengibacter hankyongi]|uniref:Heme chaperone HemW n=1 Tax=Ginsengibacter hankyongi TaxID=2607284 RepID=A0A5J5IGT9_9BACT|nr:radical SAM family heme chaperone HemW [Ginsengibacter hankyongi]KAA9039324.1 radical SAM family heme chaperone HemW [Ginsengibacter hankyongi]